MSAHSAAVHLLAAGPMTRTTTGEAVVFWILGPLSLLAALAMVLVRSAVHAALSLVVVMCSLAAFYVVQEAPFLGAVQVIVYAGAVMVLFLFVVMLIGVDSADSLVETLRGQRVAAAVLGVGFAGLLVFPIGAAFTKPAARGLGEAGFDDNVGSIARLLFTTYVWPFEVVSALLIIAALGAMVLGHRERTAHRSQREQALARVRGEKGPVTPLPGPGVYALHDAVDRPALLPDGRPAANSVPAEFAENVLERLPDEQRARLGEPVPAGLPAGSTGSSPAGSAQNRDAAGEGEAR